MAEHVVRYSIETEQEDPYEIEGNFCSGDANADRKTVAEICDRLQAHDRLIASMKL